MSAAGERRQSTAVHQIEDLSVGVNPMADTASKKPAKVAKKAAAKRGATTAAKPRKTAPKSQSRKVAKPNLLAGGNPQIAKADGDAPVQAYIAAMPGWKRDVGRRLDALIVRIVRHRGPGRVPQLSLLHQIRQSGFLPRHVTASGPARRVEAQGRALPRHLRGRAGRSSVRRLGEASQQIARRTNLSGRVAIHPKVDPLCSL
jgi:hypothetical protein